MIAHIQPIGKVAMTVLTALPSRYNVKNLSTREGEFVKNLLSLWN